jgi:hypothetical protein
MSSLADKRPRNRHMAEDGPAYETITGPRTP